MGIFRRRRFPVRHRPRELKAGERLPDGDAVPFPHDPEFTYATALRRDSTYIAAVHRALTAKTVQLPVIGPPPPTDSVRLVRPYTDPTWPVQPS